MSDESYEDRYEALIQRIRDLQDREADLGISEPDDEMAERHLYCQRVLQRLLREVLGPRERER